MGFGHECEAIQDRALDGRPRDAEALVTDEMLDALAIIGGASHVRDRLWALRDAGVTTIALTAGTPDPARVVRDLRQIIDA
jgi:alkanesulfonate monooxygenase SsuD/methylene tetrahydromethanopterin reductase-like flavin-dependent oxidoreductase (luciferase family)